MSIFRPVGNTDEASSSMGVSGRMWSPFSPFYNQRGAVRTDYAEERSRLSHNPLTEAEQSALVNGTDPDTIVPVTASLAVGGLVVKRDWIGAAEYCAFLVKHYHARVGAQRVKYDAARARKAARAGESFTAKAASESAVTWGSAFGAIGEYCLALAQGQPPVRVARTKGEKKKGRTTVSLWDDVKRSCLAKEGNVKLPFAAYSEMPIVTCPGAGGVTKFSDMGLPDAALGAAVPTGVDVRGCASFCYSLKAFGKPSCVARQLVLTLGAAVNPAFHAQVVTAEMVKLAKRKSKPVKILRLFVDGDFRSEESIVAWMDHCVRPLGALGVTVYGYSKSWEHLCNVHDAKGAAWWPTNYVMNISSGSRFAKDAKMLARIREVPVARGGFIAVDPLQRLLWKAMTKTHGEAVWQSYCDAVSRSAGNQKESDRLLAEVRGKIHAADPCLAKKYDDYVRTIHDIEDKKKGKGVLDRIAHLAGEKGLKPGPVVQGSTWAFLSALKTEGERACPISCGSCPRAAILNHAEVVSAALGPQAEALTAEIDAPKHKCHEQEAAEPARPFRSEAELSAKERKDRAAYKASLSVMASKGSPVMHMCGDKKNRHDIVIGLH
jgi:hypothetical protein